MDALIIIWVGAVVLNVFTAKARHADDIWTDPWKT